MNEETAGIGKNEYLFQHLVAMFQTLALQQLGKLINPITGKLERDLHQARITIDMLQMLQARTAGNLDDNEKRLLDTVVMELQMNYIDEMQRTEESGVEEETEKEEIAEECTGDSAETETSTSEAEASGTGENGESGGEEEKPEKKSPKKKKAAKSKRKKKT